MRHLAARHGVLTALLAPKKHPHTKPPNTNFNAKGTKQEQYYHNKIAEKKIVRFAGCNIVPIHFSFHFILFYPLMVFSETTKTHAIGPRSGTLALVAVAAVFSFPLAPFVCVV